MSKPRIALTVGDPAGIGPEIVLRALASPSLRRAANFLVLAPKDAMIRAARSLARAARRDARLGDYPREAFDSAWAANPRAHWLEPCPARTSAASASASASKSKSESAAASRARANSKQPPRDASTPTPTPTTPSWIGSGRQGPPEWAITEAAAFAEAWRTFSRASTRTRTPASASASAPAVSRPSEKPGSHGRNKNAYAETAPLVFAYPSRFARLSFPVGQWSPASGAASGAAVALAAALCLAPAPADDDGGINETVCDAIVTGPIAKAAWGAAGLDFPGHTEYVAALCGASGKEVMLLAGGGLRVALATVHEALARVPGLLNVDGIVRVGKTVAEALRRDFGLPRARLAVLGLNPHAGEEGRLGGEEIRIVAPAVKKMRDVGIEAVGPLPADSAFYRARGGEFDAVLAMYHDQGLGPLKTVGFEDGINVTLGLPLVRASVDHGTAFDLAGRGQASSRSLRAAIRAAIAIARNRNSLRNKHRPKEPPLPLGERVGVRGI